MLRRDHERHRRERVPARSRSRRTAARFSAPARSCTRPGSTRRAFAMIAAEQLGLPIEKVTVEKGDADQDPPRAAGPTARSRRRSAARLRGLPPRTCWSGRSSLSPTTSRRVPPTSCSIQIVCTLHVAGVTRRWRSHRAEPRAARASADGRLGELKAEHEFENTPTRLPFDARPPSSRWTPRRAVSSCCGYWPSMTPAP